jgi:hypothetical protein
MGIVTRWVLVVLAACSGDDGVPVDEGTPCEGAGDPAVELGSGGREGFVAFQEGDTLAIQQDGGGRYGLYVDLSTTGLDTTAPLTTFLRFSFGEETATTDVGATLTMQCTDPGPAWYGVFAPLDDSLQDAAAVAALDGQALVLSGTVTDQTAETATTEVELVVSAP